MFQENYALLGTTTQTQPKPPTSQEGIMVAAVKKKPKQEAKPPNPMALPAGPAKDFSNVKDTPTLEAWGLVHSERGGDLWHAVRYEIKGNSAKEMERLTATLKIIAAEHIRDNIDRFKL